MIEFSIKIASRVIAITAIFDSSREYCKAYLCDEEPDFMINITASDILFEREKYNQTDLLEGNCSRNLPDAQLEITAIQRKIAAMMFAYDTLLFHGSVVAVDGRAYLFTAKSGTGKSTHTQLWRRLLGDRAVMVNDDKPFLRITAENVLACGSPWNGKHKLGTNVEVPLKAICILERAKENTMESISAKEALSMLLQQANRPTDPQLLDQFLLMIDAIVCRVSFYRLKCNMDLTAAELSYSVMSSVQ